MLWLSGGWWCSQATVKGLSSHKSQLTKDSVLGSIPFRDANGTSNVVFGVDNDQFATVLNRAKSIYTTLACRQACWNGLSSIKGRSGLSNIHPYLQSESARSGGFISSLLVINNAYCI